MVSDGRPCLLVEASCRLGSHERAHVQASLECCMGDSSSCVGLDGTTVAGMTHAFRPHLEAERALRELQRHDSVLWQMNEAAH
jgi:hypothetical protein